MSWVILLSVLVGWLLVGLAVACLFGRLIGRMETADSARDLAPPVLSYLRRNKQTTPRVRAPAQAKARRQTASRH